MNTAQLMGMRMVIVNPTPKFQLPEDLPLKDDFRAEYNSWLLKTFGWAEYMEDGMVRTFGDTAYMNEKTYKAVIKDWERYCSGFQFAALAQGGWP